MLYLVFFSFSLLTFLWLPTILIFIIHSFILFLELCSTVILIHIKMYFFFLSFSDFLFTLYPFFWVCPLLFYWLAPQVFLFFDDWLIDTLLLLVLSTHNPYALSFLPCLFFFLLIRPFFLTDSLYPHFSTSLPSFLSPILPYTRPTLFTISTPETSFITWCIRWSVNTNYLEIECVYFGFGAKYYMRFDMTSPSNRMIR